MPETFYCCSRIKDMTIDEARDCSDLVNGECTSGFGRKDRKCSVLFLAEQAFVNRGEKLPPYSKQLPPLTLGS